jgi:hypothetical protein
MAQKITVELQDDLDGGPADGTVRFGVDGAEHETMAGWRGHRQDCQSES